MKKYSYKHYPMIIQLWLLNILYKDKLISKKFEWTSAAQEVAFNELKRHIARMLVENHQNFDLPFYVQNWWIMDFIALL